MLPIMEYCSEVWGPDLLFSCDTLDKLWDNELQKIQNIFLRQLGKLRKSVPTTVVHKEMCMNPVAKGWLRASIDLLLHFMICHSNKCHRPRTSSCHKEQRGGTEYG